MILGAVKWDPQKSYQRNQMVIFEGSIYIASENNKGIIPVQGDAGRTLADIYYPNEDPSLHLSTTIWILL